MILIHVHADGGFITQCGGPDMSAWEEHQQAAKHGAVNTWAAPVIAPTFNDSFFRFSTSALEIRREGGAWHWMRDKPQGIGLATAWQAWAAFCINKWGAWFHEVTGPTESEILEDRLARLIETRTETSLGVLVNLVRPIDPKSVQGSLDNLVCHGRIYRKEVTNPRNKKPAILYGIIY